MGVCEALCDMLACKKCYTNTFDLINQCVFCQPDAFDCGVEVWNRADIGCSGLNATFGLWEPMVQDCVRLSGGVDLGACVDVL